MRTWHRFREDLRRYLPPEQHGKLGAELRALLENEALWAIGLFRFGQYLREEAHPSVHKALKVPYALAHRAVGLMVGIHLTPQTQVGPGLYIGHYGGIWISPRARIGAGCNINHEVTIGTFGEHPAPELGDRVWVGPNSTISGPVKVGSGAVVGANSLVASNLAQNAVALGVPARVISHSGSDHLMQRTALIEPLAAPGQAAREPAPSTRTCGNAPAEDGVA
jgi:serine O-acetyltransferase